MRPSRAFGAIGRAALLACLLVCAAAPSAHASWPSNLTGSAASRAHNMPTGSTPTATVSNRSVTVSWSQRSFGNGAPVSGYVIKRYDASDVSQTVLSNCSGTVSGLTCTESAVPSGTWKYSVTPKQGNWLGAESAKSSSVNVASPTLSFSSSTTLTSLPTTLSGSIANFVPGQSVTYRLDNPTTGTTLTGSISPSSVPSGGGASVSVTIPSGTANGSHTVYAVGSQGDVASATITVNAGTAYSLTESAWDLRDASSGTEANASSVFSFASDSLTYTTLGTLTSSFATSKYIQEEMYASLPGGLSASGVNYNFKFAGTSGTACFYFDTRRVSTGAVLATHGSAASPVSCTSNSVISTPLSEVTSTTILNDLAIRVYLTNSAATTDVADLGTVTATTSQGSPTVYIKSVTDNTSTSPTTSAWSLCCSGDTPIFTSGTGWDTGFSTSKYLKLTFPGYVPSGATSVAASLTHSYRSNTSGTTTCWYFDVYSGSTPLATHGSSSSPVSCSSSNTTWQTDGTISLPEINTAARANSAVIRIYIKNSGNTAAKRKSDHDVANLAVSYVL